MRLKISNSEAAPRQERFEIKCTELTLNEGSRQQVEERVPAQQDLRTRRKRYKGRLPTKKKECAIYDTTSTITDSTTETNEIEFDESNHARAPSPPSDADTITTEVLPQVRLRQQLPTAPFIEVPVLARYELHQLPSTSDNKYDNDQGIFASQMIERGTRIICERPALTLTAPGDQLDGLMAAYENLSKADRERIWDLRPAAPDASEQLRTLRFLTDRLAIDLQDIIFKPAADRSKVEQATLDDMLPKLQNAMNVWRIAARWHANRCSMTELPKEQRADLPQGTPITGLFIERAHIRHSCVPNCFASYDANLGRMNVHATRDIAAGEELTLSAFADTMYYSSAAARAEELSAWGLTCSCEACDNQHPQFATHEAARARAHTRAILLADFLTRLEEEEEEEEKEEEISEHDLTTAQSILLALLHDLKTTRCESAELARWRNVLVDRILPARARALVGSEKLIAWRVILMHARECERVGRVCYGEDRGEVGVMRRTREGAESAVRMMQVLVAKGEGEGGEEGATTAAVGMFGGDE